ncbi:hypothetical protein FOZ76_07050 [Verticiella sediminum]|uniref:Uncharacterized protein n=1 Tax=Verticiella sediminum TaxID=1247510 RepID=A0A556AVX5_9BURK|nr:hypothetical protein [Verticiella sediminum]TSH97074.1 hypothetical protein FOZ76_07050 [Verticiella sediminum]
MRVAHPKSVRGYLLVEVAIAAMLLAMGAVWYASASADATRDAGAQSTGRLLLVARGALQRLMVEHYDWLLGYEGAAEPPDWLAQPLPLDVDAAPLLQAEDAVLEAGEPRRPAYGASLRIRLWREHECPGPACRLRALVYTAEPVRAEAALDYSPELVGAIMLSTDGYGGHAPPGVPERLRGALFDAANPVGAVAGIVAVSADLDATPFHQFVRHGDDRPVRLRNRLEVDGLLVAGSGVQLPTGVEPGAACPGEGVYARSARGALAVCTVGVWFEIGRYVVQGEAGGLRSGEPVPEPSCPPGTTPFTRLGLQALDHRIAGGDIDVRGDLRGTVSGTGSVNAAGAVSVTGAFAGSVQSGAGSYVQVRIRPSLLDGRVHVDGGPDNLVHALWGCRHDG